jgi:hypothetical protein
MGDPEMMSRAERAAVTLERAWERWRIMHGLSAEPAPPVSSYVGYSIEEPWGRPRVVFGVDAREAELLAVLLDRHECVGPFYQRRQGRDGQVHIHDGQLAHETDGLSHDGQSLVHDSQGLVQDSGGLVYDSQGLVQDSGGLVHDSQGLVQDGQGLVQDGQAVQDGRGDRDGQGVVHDGQGFIQDGLAHDAQGLAHDAESLDHDGQGPVAAEHSSGPAAEDTRAHIPAQAETAEERAGQDVGQRARVPLRPRWRTGRKTESADQGAGGSEGPRDFPDAYDFPAQAEGGHRDDGAGESTETSDDYVSQNGAGAQHPQGADPQHQHGADTQHSHGADTQHPPRADARPDEGQLDVADHDAAARADGTLAEPGDRRDESPDIASAGLAGVGQAEPADGDYPEVRTGFVQADGHDAGVAGGGPAMPAAGDYADVADGLIQAAGGSDAGFAGGGYAQTGAGDIADRPAGGPAEAADTGLRESAGPELTGPSGAGLSEAAGPHPNDPASVGLAGPSRAGLAQPAEAHPGIASGGPVGVRQNATGSAERNDRVPPGDLVHPEADYQPNMSIAAELAGWAAGELPGQASARLAEWAAMGRAPRRGPQPAGKPGVGTAGVGNR